VRPLVRFVSAFWHSDTAKAQIAHQDFLTVWKDADPDIPI
jgi:hypothetical protein